MKFTFYDVHFVYLLRFIIIQQFKGRNKVIFIFAFMCHNVIKKKKNNSTNNNLKILSSKQIHAFTIVQF